MSERVKNALYAGVILVMAVVVLAVVLTSPTRADRAVAIGDRIKCPVCQGESISNSPAQMARDMMSLVRERVDAGVDDETIIAELLSSYSGAVLLDPPASGPTLPLWIAPVAAVLVGGVVIAWWMRSSPRDATVPTQTGKRRSVVAGIVISVAMAGIVVVASTSLQERTGPASGVANVDLADLEEVSNETMEAVIASNLDHPEINGMRLALAGRYLAEAEYGSALDHYLKVADSPKASNSQRALALTQMGWLVWDGNGEADLAISLFDQALEVDPTSAVARYHKAIVSWCGHGDVDTASALLSEVVSMDGPPELSEVAAADLQAIDDGAACT